MRISRNGWLSYALAATLICSLFGCGADQADTSANMGKDMSSEKGVAFSAEEHRDDPLAAEPFATEPAITGPMVTPPITTPPIVTAPLAAPRSTGKLTVREPIIKRFDGGSFGGGDFAGETGQTGSGMAMSKPKPKFESVPQIVPTVPIPNPQTSSNQKSSARMLPKPPIAVSPPPSLDQFPADFAEEAPPENVEPGGGDSTANSPAESAPEIPATKNPETDGMTEVDVYYGTDRNQLLISKASVVPLKFGLFGAALLLVGAIALLVSRRLKFSLVLASLAGVLFIATSWYQQVLPTRDGITYGLQRGSFVRGVATVTVPNSHQRGMVERPSILRFEFAEDENKHIILAKATEMNVDEFYQRMSEQVIDSAEQDLLVFVHGYNIDFDSAVRRTAQIATDLSFSGVPVCYSWPSQGTLLGYTVDENNVIWTVPHLRDFLLELANRSQAKSINIIAHSMGNRAVTESLGQISRQVAASQLPMFDQIVLAAPDVDADYFRNELAPQLAIVGRHVTLYASSDDQALAASKRLHGGYPRAGESGANLVVVPDVETIDVSGIDLSLLGHSYYGNSESILRDLFDVVRNQMPASQRSGLISRKLKDTTYWMFPRPQLSELDDAPVR